MQKTEREGDSGEQYEDASTVTVVCGPARSLGLQVPAAEMKVSRPTGHFSRKW